jgi:transcriptional regulator of acetoin/glycerol metabolism
MPEGQDEMDLARALQVSKGNLGQAAKLLGISRTTLWRRLNAAKSE